VTPTPGSLVNARGRDWIVQPGSDEAFLLLKPLGGRDDEITGLAVELEPVRDATFGAPDPERVGDARAAGLLRDAARLSFRSAAGPFRSFGRIAVEARPYQLVPLLMALKLDPVRLLIADDVGVGKTVEALLVARELLDRGEVTRTAVLCPPHLADQWASEMREKFHIDPTVVLPSTARRLDRNLRIGQSLFERYPHTIVSTDFIKSDRRRDDFLRSAPELVIVDEAHTCADPGDARGGRHQRNQLLRGLARDALRHLLLVTATPHSGNEAAFRSLLALIDPAFARLPEDLTGPDKAELRRAVARHFVQRKRGDIRAYLDAETDFPERDDADVPYKLTPEHRRLLDDVLAWARETLQQDDGTHRQRVRWWATLGLLRALASSPAAAAATLRNRAAPADTETAEEADEVGRRSVFDQMEDEAQEGVDVTPGVQVSEAGRVEAAPAASAGRDRLLAFARRAEALEGKGDAKLDALREQLADLQAGGYRPIVFCRFIDTAHYVAKHLRARLRGTEVQAVTGDLPPAEREVRVAELMEHEKRILVATDCLSEGVNLQRGFDAVLHYDLSWNPTRHEQREGRVDRYGQARGTVAVRTLYGVDNRIDGIVLDVLIKKHRRIRTSLGVSVPVPTTSDEVVDAIFEGLLLRGHGSSEQGALFDDLSDYIEPKARALSASWDQAAEREKRSQTMFAQQRLRVDEVARELEAARAATGGEATLERFLTDAVRMHGGTVAARDGSLRLGFEALPDALREAVGTDGIEARLRAPVRPDETLLTRTHPVVEALASYVLDTALDPHADPDEVRAARAGAMRTRAVQRRTTLLLARFRFHLTTRQGSGEDAESWQTLAEETLPLAFEGTPSSPDGVRWLPDEEAEALLLATPDANVAPPQARAAVGAVLAELPEVLLRLDQVATERGTALREAHERVREAARSKGLRYRVDPLLPSDLLGVYVYLPTPGAG
jgi:superfamily II DNA or RNA helicase